MKFTAYQTETGEVLYSGTADNPEVLCGEGVSILKDEVFSGGWVDSTGFHNPFPPKPSFCHVFNYSSKQWEDPRTLQDFKAEQWTQIKQSRAQAEYAGFAWDGSTFDSDATSQNRITGAVTLAQSAIGSGAPFEINWILANNAVRTLNAHDMCAVGAALGAHVQTQFSKGVTLRAQIEAATTRAEVEVVVW